MTIIPITGTELSAAFPIIVQLRPHLTEACFKERVGRQEHKGYKLVGVKNGGEICGLAGYRIMDTLAWGKILYVDDLITGSKNRSKGVGQALLNWLKEEALRLECDEFHLDSGVQRFEAHRFYLRERMAITCHHFSLKLK